MSLQISDSKIEFFPCSDLDITVKIDYESSVLNPQVARLKKLQDFESEIAPSRTFCFLHELSHLLNKNLIKGGNIDNSIVFVEEKTKADDLGKLKMHLSEKVKIIEKGILNNKNLYFKNEQARHKLLDLIGDLALSGCLVRGKIVATKPGHTELTFILSSFSCLASLTERPFNANLVIPYVGTTP